MRRLPGDYTEEEDVHRMIRVDHAGEYGALRIYGGQLAIMRDSPEKKLVQQMLAQEKKHFERFDALVVARKVRPTALMPLWHIAGFALGAATAMLGSKVAFACTVAVESVIEEHYAAQKNRLSAQEKELADTVEQFRAEEMEHHDTSVDHGGKATVLYPLLSAVIKAGSRLAIRLSTRI